MKYQDVLVSSLNSSNDCWSAIDKIEADHRNYTCSLATWNAGGITNLKDAAKAKIKALENRAYKLGDSEGEE